MLPNYPLLNLSQLLCKDLDGKKGKREKKETLT